MFKFSKSEIRNLETWTSGQSKCPYLTTKMFLSNCVIFSCFQVHWMFGKLWDIGSSVMHTNILALQWKQDPSCQCSEYFNVRKFRVQKVSRIRPFAKFRVFSWNLISQIIKINSFRGNQFSRNWVFPDKNIGKTTCFHVLISKKWPRKSERNNFRESGKRYFSRPFNFANWGVIREIREIFWH